MSTGQEVTTLRVALGNVTNVNTITHSRLMKGVFGSRLRATPTNTAVYSQMHMNQKHLALS